MVHGSNGDERIVQVLLIEDDRGPQRRSQRCFAREAITVGWAATRKPMPVSYWAGTGPSAFRRTGARSRRSSRRWVQYPFPTQSRSFAASRHGLGSRHFSHPIASPTNFSLGSSAYYIRMLYAKAAMAAIIFAAIFAIPLGTLLALAERQRRMGNISRFHSRPINFKMLLLRLTIPLGLLLTRWLYAGNWQSKLISVSFAAWPFACLVASTIFVRWVVLRLNDRRTDKPSL